MSAENALHTILLEKIRQNSLVLPTLPEIALKVRQASDDPEVNLNKMSEIIAQDPALSLGMLKVANSVVFGRSIKTETVNQAVTRIGLRQIKSIATAMAIEQMFVSNNYTISACMKKYWDQTVDITSVAIALMTLYLQNNKHAAFTIDTITLAALVHNIGVLPILTEAEDHPEIFAQPAFLQQAIIKLSNEIGVEVIKTWNFSEEFIEVVNSWNDLTRLPEEVHYLDFIRAGAVYNKIFKSELTCEVLLRSYVNKGILPDEEFMLTKEFEGLLEDAKAMFR